MCHEGCRSHFPDLDAKLAQYHNNHLGFIAIEILWVVDVHAMAGHEGLAFQ
jgi:hypothetical protein